jgi:glycosyltransferase involved in cell wall biosynthesis
MRMAHICQSGEKVMVGVERYVVNLAEEQQIFGNSVTVITDHAGLLAETCRRHQVPVVVAQDLNWAPAPMGLPQEATVSALVNQLTCFGADLVNCHTAGAMDATITAANTIHLPCVVTAHAGISPQLRSIPNRMRVSANWQYSVICVARRHFEIFQRLGFPESNLNYIPIGTKAACPAGAEIQDRPRRPNLIFVGEVSWQKGLDLAILALAELRRRRGLTCPSLDIYGQDTDDAAYMREIVDVLDLNRVAHFKGYQQDVLANCPNGDIFVMTSRQETGPLVVLEAMSRGMPIVASDVGEVTEMLPDQRYGRVIPVNSIMALADAIDSLLSDISEKRFNPRDPIERHQSMYTVRIMAERIQAVYEKALQNNSIATA